MLPAALAAALAGAAATPAPAAAELTYIPCPATSFFECSSLAVPLDRSGAVPGTIQLSIERRAHSATPTSSAVVALAGGPGQATLPLGEFVAEAIAPALSTRDLLLYDQRGTGSSNPLSCPAFEEPIAVSSIALLFERCALQVGPARGAFTTAESVADIEAVRRAAGYDKLVLYGTSYGTKVALQYAARYPQHVEALVLDSVVLADGPEPFSIPTFQAIGPAISELCGEGACAGIGSNPLAELATLAARIRHHRLQGSVYDGSGRRHASTLDAVGLLEILQAGDLNPALRALLPAAVHSALNGDPDPLLRLHLLSEGLIPNVPSANSAEAAETAGAAEEQQQIDETLFVTTSCEETRFPWNRSAPPATRLAEAVAALHAEPGGVFAPFDSGTAFKSGLVGACSRWPDASAPPAETGPLPNVPTLILSGAQDLRTPTPNARAVAALIPDAQVVVVPFTGHSVIGSDLSGCAQHAVSAFFTTGETQPCTGVKNFFSPTPVTPRRLAYIHAPRSLPGRRGQTLVAVLDTLVDLNRQVVGAILQANAELPAGASFGGLHGGYARLRATSVVLRRFSFVPGVALTGTFPVKNGDLQPASIQISGAQASGGSVRLGSASKRVTGTLGGKRFSVVVARLKLASARPSGWPARSQITRLLGRPEGPARIHGGLAPRLR